MLFTKFIRGMAAGALALAALGAHAHTVPNTPLEKIPLQSSLCAPAHEAQVLDVPEENAFIYGDCASGATINPYKFIDPDGRRDIYIGGASDKDSTRIVQDYATTQKKLDPGRDIQYFSYSEKKEITAAISAPLKDGEPLNVIWHSLGGREAVNQANSTEAKITNLVTIDPVGSAGKGDKPSSVGTWTDVTAAPSARNSSDTVASVGRFVLGTTATSGADTSQKVTTSHGNFSTMMSKSGSQQKVDDSYQK